jgi:hypothetical protein
MLLGTVMRKKGHISAEMPSTEVIHFQMRSVEARNLDSKRIEIGAFITILVVVVPNRERGDLSTTVDTKRVYVVSVG